MKKTASRAKKADFRAYFSGSRRFSSAAATLSVARVADPEQPSRFGFVVGAKAVPLATDRNLLKRRARAIMSGYSDRIRPGMILFFNFKKPAGALTFKGLKDDLTDLIHRAGILKNV